MCVTRAPDTVPGAHHHCQIYQYTPPHLDSFVLIHVLLFTIVHCFHRRLQKKKVLGFLLFLCNHVTQITIATSVTFHTNATTKTF